MTVKLTETRLRVLRRAASRSSGYVCPTPGLHAAAQDVVIDGLRELGYVTNEPAPRITDAGRDALAAHPVQS